MSTVSLFLIFFQFFLGSFSISCGSGQSGKIHFRIRNLNVSEQNKSLFLLTSVTENPELSDTLNQNTILIPLQCTGAWCSVSSADYYDYNRIVAINNNEVTYSNVFYISTEKRFFQVVLHNKITSISVKPVMGKLVDFLHKISGTITAYFIFTGVMLLVALVLAGIFKFPVWFFGYIPLFNLVTIPFLFLSPITVEVINILIVIVFEIVFFYLLSHKKALIPATIVFVLVINFFGLVLGHLVCSFLQLVL